MASDQEDELEWMRQRRAERHAHMDRDMRACIADTTELERMTASHPLPWTWGVAFHDHLFYQFYDANGRPCLGNDLTDPEDAAFLLTLVNRLAPQQQQPSE